MLIDFFIILIVFFIAGLLVGAGIVGFMYNRKENEMEDWQNKYRIALEEQENTLERLRQERDRWKDEAIINCAALGEIKIATELKRVKENL